MDRIAHIYIWMISLYQARRWQALFEFIRCLYRCTYSDRIISRQNRHDPQTSHHHSHSRRRRHPRRIIHPCIPLAASEAATWQSSFALRATDLLYSNDPTHY